MDHPDWWDWELEISPHCEKRMEERDFHETDLRAMLEDATDIEEQAHGTFVVETDHAGVPWEMIASPHAGKQRIIIVTAYPIS